MVEIPEKELRQGIKGQFGCASLLGLGLGSLASNMHISLLESGAGARGERWPRLCRRAQATKLV